MANGCRPSICVWIRRQRAIRAWPRCWRRARPRSTGGMPPLWQPIGPRSLRDSKNRSPARGRAMPPRTPRTGESRQLRRVMWQDHRPRRRRPGGAMGGPGALPTRSIPTSSGSRLSPSSGSAVRAVRSRRPAVAMTQRSVDHAPTWAAVVRAADGLCCSDQQLLEVIARLPLVPIRQLLPFSATSERATYACVARLVERGLVSTLTGPAEGAGRPPKLLLVTNIGLAVLALRMELDPASLARAWRLD